MAKPLWHIVGAAPVMVLAFRRYGLLPALAAGAGGVLIDADHLVDWTLNGGREDYSRRIVVPLHGWEFPALLLGVAAVAGRQRRPRRLAVALAAGWLGHLLLDTLVNRPQTPAGYSLLYRLRHGFQRFPGWLPSDHWRKRHGTNWGPAPREAAIAGTLACVVLLLAPAD